MTGAAPGSAPGTAAPDRYCPVCRRVVRGGLLPGPAGRPDARCPHCGSLERHRHLACLLGALEPLLPAAPVVVEVAPSAHTSPLLRRLGPSRLVSLDFDPAADRRRVDVQASMTRMPFRDRSVDLVLCFHVLEHIPDDSAAIRELARVLGPRGLGVVQVPWRPGTATDEDPAAPESERLRRFGQADHVRYYGGDFEDRLRAAGLWVRRTTAGRVLGTAVCEWVGVPTFDPIWLVSPGPDLGVPLPDRENDLAAVLDSLQAARARAARQQARALRAARRELRATRRELRAERARSNRLRRLASRRSVRLALAVSGRTARLLGRMPGRR